MVIGLLVTRLLSIDWLGISYSGTGRSGGLISPSWVRFAQILLSWLPVGKILDGRILVGRKLVG